VLIDPLVLKTLDKRDVISGLGEVIKYGLIDDADLFEKVKQQYGDLVEINDLKAYEEIVERCCSIKAKIVSQDEKESGRRAILNFGHTIAHALEAVTDFCYFQHGEAVILGMMSMCWLSAELNLITKEKFERVFNFLETALTINFPRHLSADKILKFVYFDKKVCGDRLNVILLKEVGHAIIKKEIEEKLMLKAITFLLNYFERK
jgi:3-dehydroquinate synthase